MSAYRSSLFRSLKKEVSEKLPQGTLDYQRAALAVVLVPRCVLRIEADTHQKAVPYLTGLAHRSWRVI